MSVIADHGEAELVMKEVQSGKQSADIHISSYAGYLIGKHLDSKCKIVIVSKDTDFDNVIKFWKEEEGFSISRKQNVKKTVNQTKTNSKAKSSANNQTKVNEDKKSILVKEIMKAINAAGYKASVANTVSQVSANYYGNTKILSEVHNDIKERYYDYQDIYKLIKPILSKYSTSSETKNKTNNAPNNSAKSDEIMRVLKKSGQTNEIVTQVGAIVKKNSSADNSKQQIYRAIISRYGQDKGLKIYNIIKKNL